MIFQVRQSMMPSDQHSSRWKLEEYRITLWELVVGPHVQKMTLTVPEPQEHYIPGVLSAYVNDRFVRVEEFDNELNRETNGEWDHKRVEQVISTARCK